MNKEEIEKAKGWLSALEVNSEFEASSKEYILSYIEQLEKENKTLKQTNKSYKGMLNKQNKIIDEMALAIASYDIDEEICKNQVKVFCDNEPLGVTADVCAKCIKQYFETKVEE